MNVETRLEPCELPEKLGAGGMGEVWLAADQDLGRGMALTCARASCGRT